MRARSLGARRQRTSRTPRTSRTSEVLGVFGVPGVLSVFLRHRLLDLPDADAALLRRAGPEAGAPVSAVRVTGGGIGAQGARRTGEGVHRQHGPVGAAHQADPEQSRSH